MGDRLPSFCRDHTGPRCTTRRALLAALATTCALAATPAYAQDVDASTTVELQSAITIVKDTDLDFGSFIAGSAISVFRMNPNDGTLTQRSGDAIAVGSTTSVASFTVTGTPLARVRLTNSQNRIDITRVGGTETMRVNRFRLDGGRNRRLDASGNVTYQVAGQLRIGASQAQGVYTGTFNVSVDYR